VHQLWRLGTVAAADHILGISSSGIFEGMFHERNISLVVECVKRNLRYS